MDEQNFPDNLGNLPDNLEKEQKNQFIFSDSYYDEIPEEQEKKDIFAPVTNANTYSNYRPGSFMGGRRGAIAKVFQANLKEKQDASQSMNPMDTTHLSSNPSTVRQASSFDQIVNNDYSNPTNEGDSPVFDFFAHNANTNITEDRKYGPSTVEEESKEQESPGFHLFGGKKKKNDELEVVHVGTTVVDSSAPSDDSDRHDMPSQEEMSQTEFSPEPSFSQPMVEEEKNPLEMGNFNSLETQPSQQSEIPEEVTSSSLVDEQPKLDPWLQNQPSSIESVLSQDTAPISNDFSFTAQAVEPIQQTPSYSSEKSEVNLESSNLPEDSQEDVDVSQPSSVDSEAGAILTEKGESVVNPNLLGEKSFLLHHEEENPDEKVELPVRNLEYTGNYGGEPAKSVEENKFIVNEEPSVEVESYTPRIDTTKIPDFMAGTIHTDNLNIDSGIDKDLESQLIKERDEEEARRLAENPEQQLYDRLTPMKPTQEMVYRAGGKSYIRDIVDKKPQTKPKSPTVISQEDIKPPPPVEEKKVVEPTSIEEMIESIVGVPDLENLEVKLNPFENPGVKFGFQEKEEKKLVSEDAPTNVYDEKKDNFDYDQNFQNVDVVLSDLLDQLKEKAKNENRISILARYGEDFCAREYITNPAIGRAEEIKQLILILLTPEKSGILVGKPGIGKTSIVEGLAYQLQRNNVPDALRGYRIISVKTPSLLGSLPTGETRLQTLVDELKNLDKVILFIDEIHMLIGATSDSAMDFANMFKESLGRGTIKVIGATTTEEYERYILRDKAFVRRFQRVDVEEPNREHTIKILMGTLPKIEHSTGAKLKYSEYMKSEIMAFIVDITTEYKRIYGIGSRYPDICLTLLAQAFSQAVFANRKEVNINDIRKAIENSKNIYPDVIRKELVNFDIKFKDLIREEETK